ncbi:MAG: hypothetical protein ACLGH7_06480 [Actinomycetes bacterium]
MFESLLGFVAQLSLVLWIVVTFTVVVRFVGIRFYRRAGRKAAQKLALPAAPHLEAAREVSATVNVAGPSAADTVNATPAAATETKSQGDDRVPVPAGRAADRVNHQPADASATFAGAKDPVRHPGRRRSGAGGRQAVLASNSSER